MLDYIAALLNRIILGQRSNAAVHVEHDIRTGKPCIRLSGGYLYIAELSTHCILKKLGFDPLTPEDLKDYEADIAGLIPPARDAIKITASMFADDPEFANSYRYYLKSNKIYEAANPAEFGAVNHLFLYTDIIQDTNIGASRAPIFGVAPVAESEHGKQVLYTFPIQIWIPVNKQKIDTIRIHLADEQGKEVSFKP